MAPFLLPRALPVLRQRFPSLRLFLREDLTSKLIAALKAGSLDAALIALPHETPGLETAHVVDDAFLAAIPANHPLLAKSAIEPGDLESLNIILLEDGHCLREHALAACDLEPPRNGGDDGSFAATSLHTLVQMVGSGLGVSLLPAMAVEAGLTENAPVAVRPLALGAPRRKIVVAWRAGSSRETEAKLLAETLQEV